MLTNFFVTLVLTLLAALGGYLINQLPPIPDVQGNKVLTVWLTFEVTVLSLIITGWKDFFSKSTLSLQVATKTVGVIVLLLFFRHVSKLVWKIYQAWKQGKLTNPNITTNSTKTLKTPDDWRPELLKAMKVDVEIRLNDSPLHHQEIIRVRTEAQQERIGRQPLTTNNSNTSFSSGWLQPKRWLKIFGGGTSKLDSGEPIIEAFNKSDIAGRLLILGEPGAGKTILLLELARDLIERAEQDPEKPIPVLFELTNWRDDKQGIGEWLIADLKFRYNVSENISRQWLSENKLSPLLDGLDELGLTRQKKCIDKINDFLQNNSSLLPLVVCCRREEYEEGRAILNRLRGAVYLQALSEGQITEYLRRIGVPKLWKNLQNDPDGLGELAKIPLFLSLIPIAYPDGLKNTVKRFNSEDEREQYQKNVRKNLFDAFIKRKLETHHDKKGYKTEDTKRWLIWLAQKMEEHNLKEFYMEQMQPSYLDNKFGDIQYYLTLWLISGLIFGVIFGLIFGVNNGFIAGTIIGAIYLIVPKINATETLKIGFNFKAGLLVGLIIGVISNLVYGLICGMIYGLISGMRGERLNYRKYPNQGIQESAKNTAIFIFIASPITILLFLATAQIQGRNLNVETILIQGFSFALFCGINFAGNPILQDISLRLILWKNGSIPWNYAHFLTYASDRKLINKVGGRFTFLHALLQEHFAQME
ncbi:NACHT domain-containing protein [Mastigocoleus sp. MO_188.B34]|uniref:NACHT domain-containing protein n=1 Tax=Mastigocoleus sp. MO_188.B34 TaxID=3036635 RepID=UPI00261CB335|nr:NACHT domain-containing protein [Mastigocoleus sp. MO_188.B34]MDJ0693989.1 NACHT domain-containing protein [Mastigocoleus sp. MO_188.B34]